MRTTRSSPLLLCGLFGLATLAARPAAADMTINVEKLSSNGMEVRRLSCKLTSGGLLGSIAIVGELAKHKKAFDKCAPGGAAFATEFTWKNGKATGARVTASSEPRGDACVVSTLKQTKAAVEGSCSATLLTGDKAKAEAAAQKLDQKK